MPAFDPESRVDTRPPLMPLSLAASFGVFGPSVAAARLGPFLAVFFTLFVVYAIGSALGHPLAGGVAAVLVAADNFAVLASRTARPEAWVMLFGSGALLLVIRSRSWPHACAAGACAGTSCLFQVLGLGWVAAIGLLLVFQEGRATLRARRTYAFGIGAGIVVLPFVLWLAASADRIDAAKQMYGRDTGSTVTNLFEKEKLRFSDYIGVPNDRLHFPVRVPLRVHVVLAIIIAFAILWRRKRVLFWTLVLATVPHLFWLIRLPSPSPRYLAVEAPLFALAIGLAVTSIADTRWYRAAIAACALCVITQLAGTAVLLNQARGADYPALTKKLRASIPAGHSCYGALSLQFALVDRTCHSYDRTPFSYTANVQRPEYMILGDRDMMSGSGLGEDNFADIRNEASAFVLQHGRLTATIDDPFYGTLRVYRVTYPALDPQVVAR